MRLKGSVLIVVLGLLAVLAVVGVAFVTMSSIESNTSANFALQAQFDLAADGAVDYVCQALIRDVWEFNTDPAYTSTSYRAYTGYMLTGKFGTQHYDWPDPVIPAALNTVTPIQDAFLATTWSSGDPSTVMPTTTAYSFRAPAMTLSPKPYLLNTWGLDTTTSKPYTSATNTTTSVTVDVSPNNLGIPETDKGVKWWRPQNGLWIPELAFPYESGLIRCSVTVQDHAAMVNLNAHGTPTASGAGWAPYGGKAVGQTSVSRGYYVCDLSPAGVTWLSGFTDITGLLDGTRTPPGRWGNSTTPGNKRLGEIFAQNPTISAASTSGVTDRPFTLDDEFELRRLTGTYAKSRLEQIIGSALDSTPSTTTTTKVASRLGLTTVGWNAEVMPGAGIGMNPKCDINLAGTTACPIGIQSAMFNGCVLDNTSGTGLPNIASQFSANVQAFKNRGKSGSNYFKTYDGKYGARRQVFLSKISAKVQVNYPDATHDTWTVRAQVFNPWYGSYAGDTASGIDTSNTTVNFEFSGGTETIAVGGAPKLVTNRQTWDTTSKVFTKANGGSLPKITLKDSPGIIDQIDSSAAGYGSIGAAATIKKRPFGVYDEPRGTGDTDSTCIVTVLYVKSWETGDDTWIATPQGGLTAIAKGNGIPIRFPHSVPMDDATGTDHWDPKVDGPLPPYYSSADATAKNKGIFKAFLRVGDLNQVLCPNTEAEASSYWPWITRVADASGTGITTAPTAAQEQAIKWDWMKTGGTPAEVNTAYASTVPLFDHFATPNVRQFRRYHGGNVFCVDSPWADSYDNDGDGKKDVTEDTALDKDTGKFCGQEIRVAGRININTATDQTIKALGSSLTGDEGYYNTVLTTAGNRPFRSPVEILRTMTTPSTSPDCFGPLEKRDYHYTIISNIASVRSDTFSIYGTVQFLYPPSFTETAVQTAIPTKIKIVRTRRFWALVDRSPALSASPGATGGSATFSRPRVMNFQWLD